MEIIFGFRIGLWERIGFRFKPFKDSNGNYCLHGYKEFGTLAFNLMLLSNNAIARIDDIGTKDFERHAVSEDDAIEWFCQISKEFSKEFNSTLQMLSSEEINERGISIRQG